MLPPTSTKKSRKPHVPKNWHWGEVEEQTFVKLKDLLCSPPILGYPEFYSPFELHTDASGKGLGAVLYQVQDGKKRVISYASRSLSKSEKNYSAFKLEFLALKWAVTEKFRDYLLRNKFVVYTDNNPLTHILTSAKLEATGQRWVSALGEFDFDIVYRPGSKNTDADIMSRYPMQECSDGVKIEQSTIKAICSMTHECTVPLINVLPCNPVNLIDVFSYPGQTMAQVELRQLRQQQRNDPIVGVWVRAVIDKCLPRKDVVSRNPVHQTMSRNFSQFKVIRNLLYRETLENGVKNLQLVLPSVYKKQVLLGTHDHVGHPGKERTISLVRERFYWPGYTVDIGKYVDNCPRCLRRKSNVSRAPMISIESGFPLDLVTTDFLKVDQCRGGIGNILVITDHYTKFSVAVATQNQTAKTTADVLLNHFIFKYGIPARLLSDQGPNFESEVIKETCKVLNIDKVRTTVYHPQCNGSSERYNRSLLSMLGTLEPEKKADWKKYLPSLVYAFNATKHESTGFSPFELMFGRKAKLPIDSVFNLDQADSNNIPLSTDYAKQLKASMDATRQIADRTAQKARTKQKFYFDKKAKASNINIGDFVLVKILAFSGPHKLADKFEEHVYEVIDQPNKDIPVFDVKNPDGQVKRLHRNHLLPYKEQDIEQVSENIIPRQVEVQDDVGSTSTETRQETMSDDRESTVTRKPVPKPRRHLRKASIETEVVSGTTEVVEVSNSDTGNIDLPSYVESSSSSESELEYPRFQSRKPDKRLTGQREDVRETERLGAREEARHVEQEEQTQESTQDREMRTVSPRRSTRVRKKPVWYDSYVVGQQQISKLLQLHLENTKQVTEMLNNS